MKHVSITFLRVLLLVAGLMIWQAKSADAHGLSHTEIYQAATAPAQSADVKADSSVSKAKTVIIKAASSPSSQKGDCKGGCCSMSIWCFAATLSQVSFEVNSQRDSFERGLPELSLPPGPPSSLLRPPRFSA